MSNKLSLTESTIKKCYREVIKSGKSDKLFQKGWWYSDHDRNQCSDEMGELFRGTSKHLHGGNHTTNHYSYQGTTTS